MSRKRPAVPPDESAPGCLYFRCTLALGLWIVFYPRPYWLALGIGFILPPVAFLLYRLPGMDAEVYIEDSSRPSWQSLLSANSSFLVLALGVRWWREYTLIAPLPWAVATQLSAAALVMASLWYRRRNAMLVWRALIFSVYIGSLLGLANKHLDDSSPELVQGTVVAPSEWADEFFYSYRYFVIAPYLHWDSKAILLPYRGEPPFAEGQQVCTARHRGWLGMPWSSYHAGACASRALSNTASNGWK